MSLTFLPVHIGFPCQASIESLLPSLIITCSVVLGCFLLEACSFMKGNGGGMRMGERGGGGPRRNKRMGDYLECMV